MAFKCEKHIERLCFQCVCLVFPFVFLFFPFFLLLIFSTHFFFHAFEFLDFVDLLFGFSFFFVFFQVCKILE